MSVQEIKRLQRVLSVLEVKRDSIRREMAVVMAKRQTLIGEQHRLENLILGIVEGKNDEKVTSVANLHEREMRDNALFRLEDQKSRVVDAVEILDVEEIAPVRVRLDEAELRYGSVERLLERRRDELKESEEKKDNLRMDDVGALRWFDQNKRGVDSGNSDED